MGWINTQEAAELSGYTLKTVRILARKGRVVAKKVLRDWLIDSDSLVSYKAHMDALGNQKHNPWRDDLATGGRGREG